MNKFYKLSIFAAILAIAAVFAFSPSAVQAAEEGEFDLSVKHNINGRSLGLDKELPVDVYVNGGKAFSFEFGDVVPTSLPAGDYFIEVKIGETVVASLQTGFIPAGVDVSIRATLGAGKAPTLRVGIK